MGIVKNLVMRNTQKKLGGMVYYQAMGQTRNRELAANVSNPRTQAQMEQRTKWANLVNFYRANAGWMKFAFETKKTNQSEYNKFMSLNVPSARIYLPKSIASQGGCIVDAYQMTQGSLASIEVVKSGAAWQTNLYLVSATDLDENSTVGEVTAQLLPANPALREGDQLSFLRFSQLTNGSTGVPFVVVRKYEVILKADDTRRFFDFLPEDYITFGGTAQAPCIEVTDSGNAGGFILILSRTIGGKTYVSSQSIVVANNSALIDAYSSSSAIQEAIDSYGESEEPFLSSTTANEDSQAAVRPSIVSVKIGTQVYTPGSVVYPLNLVADAPVEIVLSSVPDGNFNGAEYSMVKGGSEYTNSFTGLSLSNNKLTGAIDGSSIGGSGGALGDINLSFSSETIRAVFLVPNEATITGLE